MMFRKTFMLVVLLLSTFFSAMVFSQQKALKIDYEKYQLKNGLKVILHQDKSDPIVAVAILFHVGSNREEKGRTGFAHLFEHMLFQESQHVGQDQFFKKIQEAGGTLNGGTFEDGTIYYEVVPKNALEMVLWMESDRMGYILPTVTQEAFENQQNVVQNEKRQRVDNVPYGHTNYVIHKLLYPENHPYNWQVIGSFEDLQNATIEDIHNFYKKWYGPNNATLVIAGDFDEAQTKAWVEKYFGELKPSPPVSKLEKQPVTLTEIKKAFHEDNFAKSPELTVTYPTVEQYHKDSYALTLLANLLADGKKAPLYKVIVEEKKLAPSVSAGQNSREIAGDFRIRVRAFPNVDLDSVAAAINSAFARFEAYKFTEADLDRIKARIETDFYNGISSVLGKSFQLAFYNEYAGSPDFITQDIQNTLNVTSDDIWRVYYQYIKNKPYVMTSFVPAGSPELAVENSMRFPVEEETAGSAETSEKDDEKLTQSNFTIEPIPSSFDRSVEPPKGPLPEITLPKVWEHQYPNGLKVFGIENTELPLIEFSLTVKGGGLFDNVEIMGVANLVGEMMMEGTRSKTPQELEEAIERLGANIRVNTDREAITITVNTLASKFDEVVELFKEILLEPRWDEKEFERVKKEIIERIRRSETNPQAVAGNVFRRLIYGYDLPLGHPITGDEADVEAITIDDLKAYYNRYIVPNLSFIAIAGAISSEEAQKYFGDLVARWKANEVQLPQLAVPGLPENTRLYFVDMPKAKQSVIYAGHIGLSEKDPDFHAVNVANYRLGGSFNSILNMILREEKGYTYGARSTFTGSLHPGMFIAYASVQSNYTKESLEIFKTEIEKYHAGITADDLAFTKNALILSNLRRLETLGAQRAMLEDIGMYDKPADFIKQEEEITRSMTVDKVKELVQKYIHPNNMIYLVVGDAATQAERVGEVGLGAPIMLDKKGAALKSE